MAEVDPAQGPGSTARVVVLDQDPDSGATAAAVIAARGFEAVPTDDLELAAESVRFEGVAVLVVSSPVPPHHSTPEVVAAVRRHRDSAARDVGIVVLVDEATGADAAIVAGADSALVRPVEADRLVEAVGDVAQLDSGVRSARRRAR